MDLSRFCAAPSARLGHLAFECDRAFPTQCWVPSTWIVEACVDAPFNARSFSDCVEQVISAVVCPAFECGFHTPLACMVSVDRVQIVDASTWLLASIWFSQPRLM